MKKKRFFAIIELLIINCLIVLFMSSCASNKQDIKDNNQIKIQQLEKNDIYVPWWKK